MSWTDEREAGKARAAFETRMKQFQAKLGWSKENYYQAAKRSVMEVAPE